MDSLEQSQVVESLRLSVQERIRVEGMVRISKETGAFVAR